MRSLILAFAVFVVSACASSKEVALDPLDSLALSSAAKVRQQSLAPKEVLQILKNGNERFASGKPAQVLDSVRVHETAHGQFPYAAVLGCMDSRTAPELLFDSSVGDLFSVRVAGNVLNEDSLASLEYAAKAAGAKLIVVMGHTRCGAVHGAFEHVKLGHLPALLEKLDNSVKEVRRKHHGVHEASEEMLDEASKLNVRAVVAQVYNQSDVLRELVVEKKLGLVGALYDVETGRVHFLDEGDLALH